MKLSTVSGLKSRFWPVSDSVPEYFVSTFYKFKALSAPSQVQIDLEEQARLLGITGLIIIGSEGFNATIACASKIGFDEFKAFVRNYFTEPELFFKDSISKIRPFRRFKVKIRPEIVTLATPELVPGAERNHHLSPREWNEVLKNEGDVLVIDTRNWYETKIGTFTNAINPGIDKFTEFPAFVEKHEIAKDKKMLIFCTGGIRCEKGILELQRQGFENVFQLEGGILNYLAQFPNEEFKGECFVFDQRVALTQDLKPTNRYSLCPHCGQPSEIKISCACCGDEMLICDSCIGLQWKKDTCSKDCSYRLRMKARKRPMKESEIAAVVSAPPACCN